MKHIISNTTHEISKTFKTENDFAWKFKDRNSTT